MMTTRSKPGRKPRPANQGQRVSLGLKVTAEVKNALDAAARLTGRTQSQEAEWRLGLSLDRENLIGQVFDLTYRDPHLVAALLMIGEAMRDTLTAIEHPIWDGVNETPQQGWIDDPDAFDEVARAAKWIIEAFRPVTISEPQPRKPFAGMGEPMARGTVERLIERWSQPFPWLETARNRTTKKTMERLRQYNRVTPGRIAIVPKNSKDNDDFLDFRARSEEEEEGGSK
jgi:hypothetical protein